MTRRVKNPQTNYKYDVCLSFAGEQRSYVEKVADALTKKGLRVFFDEYEEAELWGKNLYEHLDDVYQHLARYCILFASAAYARKVWTTHERRSAQARALREKGEYILPARFDDTPIPGLPDTVHYLDLRAIKPTKLANITAQKIGILERRDYLPPIPNRLFERLAINAAEDCENAKIQASHFLETLGRMTAEEQETVLKIFLHGCPADLPNNIHINIDLLRRVTGKSPARLKRIAGQLRSLGFTARVRDGEEEHEGSEDQLGESEILELDWNDLSTVLIDDEIYPPMLVINEMVMGATEDYCESCGWKALERLDFSQLSRATSTKDPHRKRRRSVPDENLRIYGRKRRRRRSV